MTALCHVLQAFVDKFRYNAKRASLVQSRIKVSRSTSSFSGPASSFVAESKAMRSLPLGDVTILELELTSVLVLCFFRLWNVLVMWTQSSMIQSECSAHSVIFLELFVIFCIC